MILQFTKIEGFSQIIQNCFHIVTSGNNDQDFHRGRDLRQNWRQSIEQANQIVSILIAIH